MGSMDKFDRFEDAFERGRTGEVGSYNAWLQENGFAPEKANEEYVKEYMRENPEEAHDHVEELETIAEYIGYFSENGGEFHIPIVGVSGVGKTQLLHAIKSGLSRMGGDELNLEFHSAPELGEVENGEQKLFEVSGNISEKQKPAIVMLDDCGGDDRVAPSIDRLSRMSEDVFVITSWSPEHWGTRKPDVEEAMKVDEEVYLEPLSEEDATESVQKIAEISSSEESSETAIPSQVLKNMYEYSQGIPKILTKVFFSTLRETYLKKRELWDSEMVDVAAKQLGIAGIRDKLSSISGTKLMVLKHTLLSQNSRGIQPSKLVEYLNKDKSTISYHLQDLSSENIIEPDRSGVSVFYRVREELKPFVQLRLEKEVEFHA